MSADQADVVLLRRVIGLAVGLYAMSTVIESTIGLASFGRISRVTALVLIAAVGASLQWRIRREGLNIPLLCLIGITVLVTLSRFWTWVPDQTDRRTFTFAALAVTSIALSRAVRLLDREVVRWVTGGLVLGAFVSSILIVQNRFGEAFLLDSSPERSAAGIADPNDIALCLAALVPVCLTYRHRLTGLLVACMALIAMMFTGSRGGLVALVAGLVAFVFVRDQRSPEGRPRRLFLMLGALSLAFITGWRLLPPALVERFSGVSADLQAGSFTGRDALWGSAISQFQETPLLGTGAGTAAYVNEWSIGIHLVPHSTFLTPLVELGILGGILMIIAVGWSARAAWRCRTDLPWAVPIMVTIMVGTIALSWEYNKFFWLILVLFGALESLSGKQHDIRSSSGAVAEMSVGQR